MLPFSRKNTSAESSIHCLPWVDIDTAGAAIGSPRIQNGTCSMPRPRRERGRGHTENPSMKHKLQLKGRHSIFDRFAGVVTRAAGSQWAFTGAVAIVVIWALTGPFLDYSESWQLVINTGTTIVTFMMVFLIQQSQNKDSLAIHIKLNELLASQQTASNRTISIEDLDEEDLLTLREFYCRLSELAQKEGGIKATHSLDDAQGVHARKSRRPENSGKAG